MRIAWSIRSVTIKWENGLGACIPACESHLDCMNMLNLREVNCNAMGECIPVTQGGDDDEDVDDDVEHQETTGSGCTPDCLRGNLPDRTGEYHHDVPRDLERFALGK